MSTVDTDLEVSTTATAAPAGAEVTQARMARVGSFEVRRLLPLRQRRTVGAWCFVDHYGPQSVDAGPGMNVPPHPHMGLQTVTWLFEGDVLHRDSIGSEQLIKPGQLNLMTSGRGIAHSEQSPSDHGPRIHGVQLWVALPDASRNTEPGFEHHASLPDAGVGSLRIRVFMGQFAGVASPARIYSEIVGAELHAPGATNDRVPLNPAYEHAVFAAAGSAQVAGVVLEPGSLLHLEPGLEALDVRAEAGARLILLGGVPFGETVLMWWNFVARTAEEMADAVGQWNRGERFGDVDRGHGTRMSAPQLDLNRLRLRAVR